MYCGVAVFNAIVSMRVVFFFNYTATTEIYTLSLHDALPIFSVTALRDAAGAIIGYLLSRRVVGARSEEHTSELQSHNDLVCRLLLEKKKKKDLVAADGAEKRKSTQQNSSNIDN